MPNVRARLQHVAVSDHEIRELARFNRTQTIGHTQNLRRVKGDSLQRFSFRQAVRGGHARVEWQVTSVRA